MDFGLDLYMSHIIAQIILSMVASSPETLCQDPGIRDKYNLVNTSESSLRFRKNNHKLGALFSRNMERYINIWTAFYGLFQSEESSVAFIPKLILFSFIHSSNIYLSTHLSVFQALC